MPSIGMISASDVNPSWGILFLKQRQRSFRMKSHKNLFTKILIVVFLVSALAGCSSQEESTSQPTDAITQTCKLLELPELPLEFVENTGMANSPSGDLEVANYRDGEGRIFSLDPSTHQVVEIDARAILSTISSDVASVSQEEIKAKAMAFAQAVIPDFNALQPSLQYEEGGKGDNYFFTWYGEISAGAINRPFLQFGFYKNGVLFAYYNTLSMEK
jgi:hypothetical protein